MTKTLLKQNITKVINEIEDETFLQAVYTIVSNRADNTGFEINDELKKELDLRKENHKEGISKSYSWQSVKKSALGRIT